MTKVTFISPDETRTEVEVKVGQNLMQAAIVHGVEGIIGDCGGVLSCATCHVLVEDKFLKDLPQINPNEDQMLDFTALDRQPNSRLSCQLVVAEALDGLVVKIADPQL